MTKPQKVDAPPNAAVLPRIIKALDEAKTAAEAVGIYRSIYQTPGCDDWLLAELGKADLFFLLTQLLRRPDAGHPWLYQRCREVEASPDGHLDLWAREHYKSTIITFALTIQDILRDPEITVGIFSHTRPIAKKFLLQIKTELEVNDTLKALYPTILWEKPKAEAPKWSEDEGIVVKRAGNPKESTVEAWGLVDGQPTSKHFRLLIYDDVVVKGSVTNPEMIGKTTQALEESYNLGAMGGVRRAIGTRWHFNDSYRTVIDRGTFKPRIYNGTVDNSGDIKRPVLLTPEQMAEKRKDMGAYTFGCQILQNPKHDSTHGFKREHLQHWKPDDGRDLNIYLLRDPANSKKEAADYTSDWVVGLGPDENYYVLALYRYRLNLTQRTEQLFTLHRKWRPIEVRYEEYGLQSDIEHIESEMDRRKHRFKITKVAGKTSKPDRIERLIPLFEQERVILPHSFHVTVEGETKDMVHSFIEEEYLAWPVPLHDDMLDALSRIAEPDLPLKWPVKKRGPKVALVEHEPLDRGMGM